MTPYNLHLPSLAKTTRRQLDEADCSTRALPPYGGLKPAFILIRCAAEALLSRILSRTNIANVCWASALLCEALGPQRSPLFDEPRARLPLFTRPLRHVRSFTRLFAFSGIPLNSLWLIYFIGRP